MTQKNDKDNPSSGTIDIERRDFLKFGGALTSALFIGSTGVARALTTHIGKTLNIGVIDWDEDIALAYLTKVILEEELGFDVNLTWHKVEGLFEGVANGSLDIFQDVWLPRTHHDYWKRYGDQFVRLGSWYQGFSSLGLAVPDYVHMVNIGILPAYHKELNGEIVGIEQEAGEMRIVKREVMSEYHLYGQLDLSASSTPHMLKELDHAIRQKKPIVVTLYRPHWAFSEYKIRNLKDPFRTINWQKERIYSVVRRGMKRAKPDAYAFLDAISLSHDQLLSLELAIHAADGPVEGVRNWLRGKNPSGDAQNGRNYKLVEPWIDAAKRARHVSMTTR